MRKEKNAKDKVIYPQPLDVRIGPTFVSLDMTLHCTKDKIGLSHPQIHFLQTSKQRGQPCSGTRSFLTHI